MLRGLLHPSEYKEILFQVSQQPKVTYGHERRESDIAREKLRARKKELREKIKKVQTLSEKGRDVKNMATAIKLLSKGALPSQEKSFGVNNKKTKILSNGGNSMRKMAGTIKTFSKESKCGQGKPLKGKTGSNARKHIILMIRVVNAFKEGLKSRKPSLEESVTFVPTPIGYK